jgi:hypothetical protein
LRHGGAFFAPSRNDQQKACWPTRTRGQCCRLFQLRGIWAYGRRRLARLVRDLSFRQQEREGRGSRTV